MHRVPKTACVAFVRLPVEQGGPSSSLRIPPAVAQTWPFLDVAVVLPLGPCSGCLTDTL